MRNWIAAATTQSPCIHGGPNLLVSWILSAVLPGQDSSQDPLPCGVDVTTYRNGRVRWS